MVTILYCLEKLNKRKEDSKVLSSDGMKYFIQDFFTVLFL